MLQAAAASSGKQEMLVLTSCWVLGQWHGHCGEAACRILTGWPCMLGVLNLQVQHQ